MGLDTLDETKPYDIDLVSSGDDEIRQTRLATKQSFGLEHYLSGQHKLPTGPAASRPAAGMAGRLFLNTDNNNIEYDNGSAWIPTTISPSQVLVTSINQLGIGTTVKDQQMYGEDNILPYTTTQETTWAERVFTSRGGLWFAIGVISGMAPVGEPTKHTTRMRLDTAPNSGVQGIQHTVNQDISNGGYQPSPFTQVVIGSAYGLSAGQHTIRLTGQITYGVGVVGVTSRRIFVMEQA